MTRLRRCRGSVTRVAAVALLLCPLAAAAGTPENFFAALDAAAVVAVGQVERVEQPAGARLVIVHLRATEGLKGVAPTPASLSVVQELMFPSDTPAVAAGARGLCVLMPMPNYSAYRSVLGAGPYYQFAGRQQPLRGEPALAAARRWFAVQQLPPAEQAATRVQVLLDVARDAGLGTEALDAIATTGDLRALLDRVGYDGAGAVLRDAGAPLEQRRRLLAILADHQTTGALPMLRSVHDRELAPFLRQTIVALGGTLTVAQLQPDLEGATEDQRMAGVSALAAVAARTPDKTARRKAIAALAHRAVHDPSAAVRIETVDRLATIGADALPAIARLLSEPDKQVVYAAGRGLGTIGTPAATRALAQQFKRGTYSSQVAAVFGLRAIATPEAMEVLAAVKASPPDPRLEHVIELVTGEGLCRH